jgi:D-alanyl-D-alanine carboxypeptidase (penicillin-binding protein 5/6)
MSATAKRDGMHLIAVVMGSPTRDIRNAAAKELLDYGFAGYSLYESPGGRAGEVPVKGGVEDLCGAVKPPVSILLAKGKARGVTQEILLDTSVTAPVEEGQQIGTVRLLLDGEVLREDPVTAASSVPRIGFGALLWRMLGTAFLKSEK